MINTAITMNPDGTPEQLAATVRLAESLGFNDCYVADQGFTRDVYVTLAMLALKTKRIRLGPGITHPYLRHPVVTAVNIATLDELSEGRSFLGIGAGGSRALEPVQVKRQRPLRACRETVDIARKLWQGNNSINYRGQMFQLKDASILFPCRPDIEIHWAARGPKMLSLGGELGDVNILHAIPRFALADVMRKIREGAQRSGRPVNTQYALMLVYDEHSRQIARMRTVYRLVDSSTEVKNRLGLTTDRIAEMRRLVTSKGPQSAAHLVDDTILKHYIYDGSPEECATNISSIINEYHFNGITIEVPDPADAQKLLHFASQVISRLSVKEGKIE